MKQKIPNFTVSGSRGEKKKVTNRCLELLL